MAKLECSRRAAERAPMPASSASGIQMARRRQLVGAAFGIMVVSFGAASARRLAEPDACAVAGNDAICVGLFNGLLAFIWRKRRTRSSSSRTITKNNGPVRRYPPPACQRFRCRPIRRSRWQRAFISCWRIGHQQPVPVPSSGQRMRWVLWRNGRDDFGQLFHSILLLWPHLRRRASLGFLAEAAPGISRKGDMPMCRLFHLSD